jgi:hypothetical protein
VARVVWPVGPSLLLALSGCMQMPESTALIPFSPFTSTTSAVARMPGDSPVAPAATAEAAVNVARVGRKLVAANPALGLSPSFVTVGGEAAAPELFHRGDAEVIVTESLARKCKTESELAAVLSRELAKMASEHTMVGMVVASDRGPPPAVNVGNDYGGMFGPADIATRTELARYDQKRARAREQLQPPDPDVLARAYLQRAGFDPAALDAVAPLLTAADANGKLEKLMTPVSTR